MSGPFNVGDVVVCVDDSPARMGGASITLRRGRLYKISEVHARETVLVNEEPVHVVGLAWGGWANSRFRHLPKADSKFAASMRACKPIRVGEPA